MPCLKRGAFESRADANLWKQIILGPAVSSYLEVGKARGGAANAQWPSSNRVKAWNFPDTEATLDLRF